MNRYKNILLVEDDLDDQEFFSDALNKVDHTAKLSIVSNGKQALDLLSSLKRLPNIIFLDLHLPLMNGLEFLSEINKAATYKGIPVIIFTSPLNHLEECYQLGAIACINKPASDDCFRAILREVLGRDVVKEKTALRRQFAG